MRYYLLRIENEMCNFYASFFPKSFRLRFFYYIELCGRKLLVVYFFMLHYLKYIEILIYCWGALDDAHCRIGMYIVHLQEYTKALSININCWKYKFPVAGHVYKCNYYFIYLFLLTTG